MAVVRIALEGDKSLMWALRTLPDRVQGGVSRKALRAAGAPIVKAYRRNMRRHTKTTGKIGQKVKQYTTGVTVTIVGPISRMMPHAHLIEFGTKPRTQTTTGRYTGVMPEFGPLRRAWDETLPQARASLAKKLRQEIDKAAAKLAKK